MHGANVKWRQKHVYLDIIAVITTAGITAATVIIITTLLPTAITVLLLAGT